MMTTRRLLPLLLVCGLGAASAQAPGGWGAAVVGRRVRDGWQPPTTLIGVHMSLVED
jgi:hypothetical protein